VSTGKTKEDLKEAQEEFHTARIRAESSQRIYDIIKRILDKDLAALRDAEKKVIALKWLDGEAYSVSL
jgi:GTP1/Obg family GTP-binding protein